MTLFQNISHHINRLFFGVTMMLMACSFVAMPASGAALPELLDPPTSNGISDFTGLEDASIHIVNLFDVFDDDIDPDASLTFTIEGNTNLTLLSTSIDDGLGLLTVTFTENEFGSGEITVRATDTSLEFTDETFLVTINSVNDAPTFSLGTPPTVNEDAGAQTVNNLATSILTGPPNESGQSASFSITSNTNPGLFSVGPDVNDSGTLTYTPVANVSGSAIISLVLIDDGGTVNGGDDTSITQNFTITVNEVNDEPSFTAGASVQVDEDSGAFSQTNWATGLDAGPNESSQNLTFDLSPTNSHLFASDPTVSSTGTLTFTPALNANGTSTVTIFVTDDGGTANGGDNQSPSQSFTITLNPINDRPTTSGIGDQTDFEDTASRVINLTSAFDDVEDPDANLTFTEIDVDNPALFSGNILNQAAGTYTINYVPDANGTSNITIRATDTGGEFVDEMFQVNLLSVNDEPSFTKGPDQVVSEDAGFQTISNWASNISRGPANEDSQNLTFEVVVNNSSLFQSGPSISETGQLTFQPATNASGTAEVTVTLMDDGGTANGGDSESPPQSFNITINEQNDQPTSTPIADIQVEEDAANQLVALFNHFDDIEDNDNELSYTVFSNSNASLVSIPAINSSDGLMTLQFTQDGHGTANIVILVTDSGGLTTTEAFDVEVLSVNDAPSFTSGGNVFVPEDSDAYSAPWAMNVAAGPANEATQTVTFDVSISDATFFDVLPAINSSGTLSFTPKADVSGNIVTTVTLQDNGGTANGGVNTSAEVIFTITISAENDPPIAVDDEYTVTENATLTAEPGGTPPGVLDNDIDADGDVLNATLVEQPKHASFVNLTSSGTLVYQHNGAEVQLDSLKYIANDGTQNSEIATVIINIRASNDPPVSNGIDGIVDFEDGDNQLVDLRAAFDDPDDADEALTFSVIETTNPNLFADLPINGGTGFLEIIYAENANGASQVTIQASDPGGLTATASFSVNLLPVNDPPSMTPGNNITLDEDPGAQSISGWAQDIVPGPADEVTAGQTISVGISVSNPALFSAQPQLSITGMVGNLTFTPAPQTDGQSTITITLTDNGGLNNTASYDFLITIQGDNDKPTSLTINDINVNEDAETITFNLFDYFNDVEDAVEDLAFSLEGNYNASLFENISISSSDPRVLTINFADDAFGSTAIGIRATDTGGLFAQEDVQIDLNPVNDAPSFVPGNDIAVQQNADAYSGLWAENISIGPDNESNQEAFFTVSITNGLEELFSEQPAIDQQGNLSFTPAIGDESFGDAEISVILADNGGSENGGTSQSPEETFTISIRRFNTAPVGNPDFYFVDQGQTLSVGASNGVLANDTDPENDQLNAQMIQEPANAASFILNQDGSFTYQHNNTLSTSDAFTYIANDGFDDSDIVTVTISITPSGTQSLAEIEVLEDADDSIINVRSALSLSEDEYEFVITSISNPTIFTTTELDTLSGILTISYAPNQFGEANINISATPHEGDMLNATQKVTVLPVNDAPIAVDDFSATIQNRSIEIDVLANDIDFDGDNLSIFRLTNPTSGSVREEDSKLLYTPEQDFTGIATFSYSIWDDDLLPDEGLVTVTVFSGKFVVSGIGHASGTTSSAYNISNAGEVVGVIKSGDGSIHAFSSSQTLPLDTPSEAYDANDFGQIVGSTTFETQGNTGPVFQATLWDTLGVTNLGSFDGRISTAYSINNAAQIVGVSTKENSELRHAALWENNTLVPMEASENEESEAFDINELGLAAGYAGNDAIIWNRDQIQLRLSGIKGRAYAINDRGQTAGSIDDGTIKAIFWDDDGTPTSLHIVGSTFSEAYGVNSVNWVVGAYLPPSAGKTTFASRKSDVLNAAFTAAVNSNKKGDGQENTIHSVNNDMRAFLWQGDDIVDLNQFIDEASGWILLEANAINNAAQITGIGLLNGERQAFLLSPTINKSPTASVDIVTLTTLAPVVVDVLSNDYDLDGDSLSVTSVTQGSFGEVLLSNDGQIIYQPGDAFTGSDAFAYTIEDNQGGYAEGEVEIVMDASSLPEQYALAQNYPNPFNPQTTITFGLPEQAHITLEVFNLLGQRISTLVDGIRAAGTHTVVFDAQDLPGGVYIYRIKTPGFEQSRQLVLLK